MWKNIIYLHIYIYDFASKRLFLLSVPSVWMTRESESVWIADFKSTSVDCKFYIGFLSFPARSAADLPAAVEKSLENAEIPENDLDPAEEKGE